ncbi:hypothetical protein CIK05_02365 [Bdellovibrio sp. qaytius]|nr:hypothetical protein CIK05_02365 [Bdellovibrio sp. qaytius]
MSFKLFTTLSVVGLAFSAQNAMAWGGRGHHTICSAAVHLVQSKPLKDFLLNKPHVMGHLCNIPDIYWKGLTADQRKHGDPGHFIDVEVLGLAIKDVPTDYKAIVEKYTGKENMEKRNSRIQSVPAELGSNWWRADQFYRLALKQAEEVAMLPAPANSKEEQNEDLPYNKAFYSMFVNMGLMGHFVGDNSQPFHTTSDYDGYQSNHGGIHGYYEEACVALFGADLEDRIVKKAASLKKATFMDKKLSVVERMRALAVISNGEVKAVLKADPMTAPSTFKIEKGISLKSAAKRQPPEVGQKKFDKLIVEEMARSAVLLASFWDKIYTEAGSPELKGYKSYKYPFTPDFVMPDYYDTKVEDEAKTK